MLAILIAVKETPTLFFQSLIVHKTILENNTIHLLSENGQKGECIKMIFLKSFHDNDCF